MINFYTNEVIMEFKSVLEGANFIGLKSGGTTISKCCQGKVLHAGYYDNVPVYWRYSNESDLEKKNRESNFLKTSNSSQKRLNTVVLNEKRVDMVDLNDNIIMIFNTIKDAFKFMNFYNGAHITECCYGKRSTAGIYNGMRVSWRFHDVEISKPEKKIYSPKDSAPCKEVIGICKYTGAITTYKSIRDAARQLGLKSHRSISKALKDKTSTAANKYWKYIE